MYAVVRIHRGVVSVVGCRVGIPTRRFAWILGYVVVVGAANRAVEVVVE